LLGGGGINGVIIGWALGNVIGTGLMVAFTVVIFRPISRPTFFDLNRIMRYSAPLTLSMIVGLINANIDKIMLLGFLDTGSLGVYSTGLSIAFFLTIAGSALYSVSLTEQSWAWSGGKEKLDRIAETVLQYVFLTYIPLSVILAILAVPAATVLFTIAYVESFIVVALIGITKSVFCYDIIANGYLLAMGKTHYFLYGSFIAAISQTLLGYFLIPLSGLTGATIARCIGIAILSLYPISIMRFRYEFAFDAKYQLKIIIVSYLAAIPAYLFVISFEPLVAILGSSFIFGGLYFLGLRVGRLVTVRNVETYTLLLPKIIQHHFYLIGTKLLTRCEDQIEHSKNE
jgi:O-antigen/teichoic acid export membrane protein